MKLVDACSRDLHGNGDNDNTAVMEATAAVMVTEIAVIPRERLRLKRYYRGSGNIIL